MSQKLRPVRGTHDIFPPEAAKRRALLDRFMAIATRYGFGEFEPPMFEFSDVFHRTLGDASDIVSKETYSFEDRGGESLTLRPEFTAAVARAFISGGMQQNLPVKWWYAGPAFRYERPQQGRQRQFTQLGVELLGAAEPEADVEIIALAHQLLTDIGLADDVTLEMNSLGDAASRAAHRQALVAYYESKRDELSEQSQIRLEKNPLRILDSKDAGDKAINHSAPKLSDYFTEEAQAFADAVKAGLDAIGIAYSQNDALVRGLDYYNHTVFEFTTSKLGAQGTVLAGGRYDGLIETMGGQPTAGIGFAAGIERLTALTEAHLTPKPHEIISIIPVADPQKQAAWTLAYQLRNAGLCVDLAYKGNVAKRMKYANKIGASWVIIMGEDELAAGDVSLKNMSSGEARRLPISQLITELRS